MVYLTFPRFQKMTKLLAFLCFLAIFGFPKKIIEKIVGLIFLCLFLPSEWAQSDNLEGKKRQRKMNPKISSDIFLKIFRVF